MRVLRRKPARTRADEFYDDEYYEPVLAVGFASSDWGPSDPPSRLPWKRVPEKPKAAFGFSRALED